MNIVSAVDSIKNASGVERSSAQQSLDLELENFLTLLTTQLQNQDPTAPFDANQVTEQIASLSQVAGINDTNAKLDQLITLSSGGQLNDVVSYIGRVVEAKGNQSPLISNGEEQGAVFIYNLPTEARVSTINIFDESNRLVYSGSALTNDGRNEVVWDGTNSITGQVEPLGSYSFSIIAEDFNGNSLEAQSYTTGIVTSVDTESGNINLSLGNIDVDLDDVTAVRTAQELL